MTGPELELIMSGLPPPRANGRPCSVWALVFAEGGRTVPILVRSDGTVYVQTSDEPFQSLNLAGLSYHAAD